MHTKAEAPVREPFSSKGPAAALRGAGRTFRGGRRKPDTVALDGVDLSVGHHEVVAVVGPSGCGKSTLLELLAGLQEPDRGTVEAGGATEPEKRRAACAFMPQRDLLLPWRDALANAGLALEAAGTSKRRAREQASPLFERFGLAGFEKSRPAELSGGMRQRVAFVRTLLAGRDLLLLDEPFAALDAITRAEMQEWLAAALRDQPRTVVLVTHDTEEALFLADRVVVLSARPGRVAAELESPFPRPRERAETVANPGFLDLRRRALEALR